MIILYSGTPGSGKSLDCARTIYKWCRRGSPILCNFPINADNIHISKKKKKEIHYISNDDLNPDRLVEFARTYFGEKKIKEDSILLIIDEAQLLFNARSWSSKGRDRWNWFFTMHRHFGFFIILCAQFDRMLDRQIRSLIEYEYKHRKVNNMGWRGVFLSCLFLSPFNLFVRIKIWYPMKEKIEAEFYKSIPRYYRIYDTFVMLEAPAPRTAGVGAPGGSGVGASSKLINQQSTNESDMDFVINISRIERICRDEERVV